MNSSLEVPKPKIVLSRYVFEKIMHFVEKGNQHECSGLGLTTLDGDRVLVHDVWMVKQQNSAATTDLDAEAINKLMFEQRNAEGSLNFWWHSHADMGVFWSSTDKDTIHQIGGGGMCYAAVFNKKREVKAAVSCLAQLPFMEGPRTIFLDDLPVVIDSMYEDDVIASWNKEYDENVVRPTYTTSHYRGTNIGLYNEDRDYYDKDLYWKDYDDANKNDIDWHGTRFETHNGRYRKSPAQVKLETEEKKLSTRGSLPALPSAEQPKGSPDGVLTSEEISKWELLSNDSTVEDYNPVHDVVIMRDGTIISFEDWLEAKKRTQRLIDSARDNGLPVGISEQELESLDTIAEWEELQDAQRMRGFN